MAAIPGITSLNPEALLSSFTSNLGFSVSGTLKKKKEAEGISAGKKEKDSKEKEKEKKKRKRKIIWPKGFDPANPGPPPDPERWLPKRERSSFKPKRKDKRSGAHLRGAQGAMEDSTKGGKVNKGASAASTIAREKLGPPKSEGGPSLALKKKGKKGRK